MLEPSVTLYTAPPLGQIPGPFRFDTHSRYFITKQERRPGTINFQRITH